MVRVKQVIFREIPFPILLLSFHTTANNTQPQHHKQLAELQYEAIIVPQTLAAGALSVCITIGGRIYEWKSTKEVRFANNNAHALTLSVGENFVSGDIMLVGDWTVGTVGDLSTVTNKGGNMVVAVTNKDGSMILWSWRLWFSDIVVDKISGFASIATEIPNSKKIMDRNLGAKSVNGEGVETYGLLYQWGRKDPFKGSVTQLQTLAKHTIYTPENIDGIKLNLTKTTNALLL